MNRIAKCLCMVAVIALAFTACKKQETDTKTLKFKGTTEQLEVVDDEFGGRMYIDANNIIRFDDHDKVAVFNCPNANGGAQCAIYDIQSNGDIWNFESGDNLGATGVYYAYYPGGAQYVHTEGINTMNRVKFTLTPTQVYRVNDDGTPIIPQNALYMAAKSDQTDFNNVWFTFKNICGVLSLKLYDPTGTKKVTRIELTDNSFNLVGDVTLKLHEVDPTEMSELLRWYDINNPSYKTRLLNYMERVGYSISGDVRDNVALDCTKVAGGGVQLGTSSSEASEFLIVLRPLALRDGCKLKVYYEGGATDDFDTDVNHIIHPNLIRKMRPINVMVP